MEVKSVLLPLGETLMIEIKHKTTGKVLFNVNADTLKGADLRDANLTGADLGGADLRWANLSGADLCGADLTGANLSGADLWGADFSGANLTGANLSGANLTGADFSGANLTGANLSGANLTGANLWGASLRWANLTGAIGISIETNAPKSRDELVQDRLPIVYNGKTVEEWAQRAAEQAKQLVHARGVINALADRLALANGTTVPQEIHAAEREMAKSKRSTKGIAMRSPALTESEASDE